MTVQTSSVQLRGLVACAVPVTQLLPSKQTTKQYGRCAISPTSVAVERVGPSPHRPGQVVLWGVVLQSQGWFDACEQGPSDST